jgi:uncharacterized membrane protein/mono/diheme cytochrome c family protein
MSPRRPRGRAALVILGLAALSVSTPRPLLADLPDAATALAPALGEIFARSCAECHDSARRPRPKGGFGHVLDLRRLAADDNYVVPGRPDQSELLNVLVTPDQDLLMPPPDSDAPALSVAEIDLVRRWILALDQPAAIPAPPPDPTPPPAPPAAVGSTDLSATPGPSTRTVIARLHPMIVHFPVALLVVAAGLALLARLRRRQAEADFALVTCLGVAALTAPLSAATGWLLASADGHSDDTVFLHRWLGIALALLAPVLWRLQVSAMRRDHARSRAWLLGLLLLAGLLVAIVGHTGGEITRGPGYPFR